MYISAVLCIYSSKREAHTAQYPSKVEEECFNGLMPSGLPFQHSECSAAGKMDKEDAQCSGTVVSCCHCTSY